MNIDWPQLSCTLCSLPKGTCWLDCTFNDFNVDVDDDGMVLFDRVLVGVLVDDDDDVDGDVVPNG